MKLLFDKKTIVFVLFVINITFGYSQNKNKQYQGAVWFRYNSNIQLPKKYLLNAELEERLFITKKLKQHQFYFRFTFYKTLPKNWNVGLGFSSWYFGTANELSTSKLMIPEWRPHFEINNKNKISENFTVSQRFRAEWRFIKNTNNAFTETIHGYSNNFRFRLQFVLDYRVYKKDEKSLHLIVFDELFINAGKSITRNIFDQNRFGFSTRYNFNKKVGIELGYINWFQQKPSTIDFFNRQILRCTLHTNYEIKKTIKKSNTSTEIK